MPNWPSLWNTRIILISWTFFSFIIVACKIVDFQSEWNVNCWLIILAYSGNLLASLTLPARSKALNTFEDLLQMPEEGTIIVKPHTSMHSIFQEATDPLLMVNKFQYMLCKGKFNMSFHILQSINDRINAQDPNVTFSTPKLPHAIERILKSETQVVKISEIDVTMLITRISHTTSSGGIQSCSCKEYDSSILMSFQVSLIFIFQLKECIPLIWVMPWENDHQW